MTIQPPDKAPGKPHPGMILNALSETGVEPGNTVMIGDTSFDILMAVAANVASIGVSWRNHPREELVKAVVNGMIEHLDDLVHEVRSLRTSSAAHVVS